MSKKNKIILYHGSRDIIDKPFLGGGNHNNDYGTGFYCTEHIHLAGEWACEKDRGGYINVYELDMSELLVLDLSDHTILTWLAILLNNRRVSLNNELQEKTMSYLLRNYKIDISKYDIIKGYRADDSYYSFVRAFISNSISLEQLSTVMKLGNLGEQIVLKSQKAFDHLWFKEALGAESTEYYPRRKARADRATSGYQQVLDQSVLEGTYIMDLMRRESRDERSI